MTELDEASWNPEIVELAREFHKRYESEARRLGWMTQVGTRVPFDDLPEANQQTMLCTLAPFHAQLAERDDEIARLLVREAAVREYLAECRALGIGAVCEDILAIMDGEGVGE